jgi:hypothetical protein
MKMKTMKMTVTRKVVTVRSTTTVEGGASKTVTETITSTSTDGDVDPAEAAKVEAAVDGIVEDLDVEMKKVRSIFGRFGELFSKK